MLLTPCIVGLSWIHHQLYASEAIATSGATKSAVNIPRVLLERFADGPGVSRACKVALPHWRFMSRLLRALLLDLQLGAVT
jgi:hypothetical protein